ITYLHAVHLVLANDLDGDFPYDTFAVACPVDVAEGTIAHLFEEFPSFEAWVLRKLALALILLGHELCDVLVRNAFLLLRLGVRRLRLRGFVAGRAPGCSRSRDRADGWFCGRCSHGAGVCL